MFHKAKHRQAEAEATTTRVVTTDADRTPTHQEMSATRSSVSVIGSHTSVHGDIDAGEDLTVEGHVEGTITCKQNTVTLGNGSRILGDVYAHTLHVSGEVEGNLVASHRATIHKDANVRGTIVTPCLMLEDGSTFHGTIDMDPENALLKEAFGELAASRQAPSFSPFEDSDTGEDDSGEPFTEPTQDSEPRQAEGST
ncbi:polymer-forming cytoskeletal protein [Billgrantia tianxiuensis]|uniref:Polymer-forming cytoskeletal protein n=1 Tax=Billgrantia tianxiuensis TaxID=2497861 RepID=A0A6I6SHW1_9GAMM|nr:MULTISPECIES: polymer-forming cytoskeletal protein [Halomonas]MCE8033400.1 polymer-forming cytoskeletal protein [Halomonas sp. MCCC 1A11057]QHC49122.1 polymer-forming cytoskeletal protein [Halomonas tianxiuensis]